MTPTKQQDIINAFNSKAQGRGCPVCGTMSRSVVDVYGGVTVQADLSNGFQIPGQLLTCAVIQCSNCGFVSLHSLDRLGVKP
jgi:hypothetical protein